MIDLTGKYAKVAVMVPSSMNPGNTTYDDPSLAMTAPGSQSILPAPEKKHIDVLPLPIASDGQIPLSNSPDNIRPLPAHPGGGTFDLPSWTGSWKPTEGNV